MTRRLSLLRLALACGLAAVAAAACTSDHERFETHQQQAETYLREGKPAEALLELRSALKLRPLDADVNFRIAEILNAQGSLADAAFFYGEAYRLDPDHIEAALSQALLLLWDEPDRARQILADVVQRHPDHPLGHVGRAHAALADGDTQAALTAALTAVEIAPDHPETHSALGVVHQARIRELRIARKPVEDRIYEAALAAFERAHELRAPQTKWAETVNRAQTLAAWPKRVAEAPAAYRQAVEEAKATGDPSRHRAALRRVQDYARQTGNTELEHWALTQHLELNPDALGVWRDLAALEDRRGGATEDVLRKLVEGRPQDAVGHLLWSGHLYEKGRVEEALRYLSDKVEEGIQVPVLLGQLARMQFNLRRFEEAGETTRRLGREYPDHPVTAVTTAQLAIAEKRPQEAIRALVALRDQGRQSVEALQLLGHAYLAAGEPNLALDALNQAIGERGEFDGSLERLRLGAELDLLDCNAAAQTTARLRRNRVQTRVQERVKLADCYYRTERPEQGRKILEPLLAKNASPGVALACAQWEGARFPEKARAALEAVAQEHPDDVAVLVQLAALDMRRLEPARAVERLGDAIARGVESPRLRLARAQAHAQTRDLEAAHADAGAAYDAEPELEGALELLAGLDRALDRPEEGVARLEAADAQGRLAVGARELLAQLYRETGQRERAVAVLEHIVAQSATSPQAKNDLAYLLAESGQQLDRATRLAQEALQAVGDNAAVADTLGYVYLRRGLLEPALEQLDFAAGLAESRRLQRPEIHYHRGLTLRQLGRDPEAEAAFEKALEIDGAYTDARDALAELRSARAAGRGAGDPG